MCLIALFYPDINLTYHLVLFKVDYGSFWQSMTAAVFT